MFQLREYQKEAAQCLTQDLLCHTKLICVMPTAAGKTEVITKVCEDWCSTSNTQVLVLSHLTELIEQTKKRIELRSDLKVGIMQGEKYPSFNDKVIVGTRQTVSNLSNLNPFKKRIGLVIVDEVHGFLTKQYETIVKALPSCKIIGFTATPYKNAKLITNFFDKISYSISLQELIDEEYILKPILHPITITENAEIQERIAHIVSIQKTVERGKSGAIFMRRVEECKIVRNILKMNGISHCIVTSKTKDDIREQNLKDFNTGKVEVLITCNVVSEGFDCPRLEVVYMPYETKSPTLYIQRMGRAMRRIEGKENCRIYAFGNAPLIKKGFYLALKMGEKKKKMSIKDDLEYLEMTGETSSETYTWGKEICKIAEKLRELGKVGTAEALINKELPKKYMKNPDLIIKYAEKIEDRPEKLEDMILKEFGKENEYHIVEGNMRGKHVEDLPWNFKKLAWIREGFNWKYDTDTYKKIRKFYRLKRRKNVC